MRTLSQFEIGYVSGGDGESTETPDTCEALGDAAGLAVEYTLLRSGVSSALSFFGAQLTGATTDSLIAGACTGASESLGEAGMELYESFEDAGEYLLLFQYYQRWGGV